VNCSRRKICVGRANGKRAIQQVIRRDVMSDIDDGSVGIDLENDTLQRADQMVVRAVVGRECDDGIGHSALRQL
jgi:hypothetical protein